MREDAVWRQGFAIIRVAFVLYIVVNLLYMIMFAELDSSEYSLCVLGGRLGWGQTFKIRLTLTNLLVAVLYKLKT